MKKSYFSGAVKKTIRLKQPKKIVWKRLSNIVGLSTWLIDVQKTVYLSKKKRGVGAIRKIFFDDGNTIEEHIVSWDDQKSFSYIAVSGLPLRAYYATLKIKPISKNSTQVTWECYFSSKMTTKKSFNEFVSYLESFYEKSLNKLKASF